MSTNSATGRPTPVTVSFILWLVTVVLGIIRGVLGFIGAGSSPQVQAQAEGQGAAIGAAVTIGAVFAIIIALVQLFIVFKMRDGRNWARIVLLVLAILQVLGIAAAFNIVGTIGVIVVIIAAVLMFLPSSNAYFRKR
ncbi:MULTISPECIES: hypothetical protein [Curtobacterium]|uniref:hypothetical protein n=1 Tax=Curtobacterium TaxID=2034 RepID=UPI000DA73F92|nr:MULTISPECIES: hypothetical protein [Curtobacterium]MBY0177560.1 hypothetical protein [Curtobacterium herbarum]MCP1503516.1 putative spore protein YtfJ [Curtobacterium herbarum]MDN3477082.1 hypothetical protein [Curtobacterium sp. APC 4022]MDN4649535.1 hypothetical protein [Curtobacterium sp. PsM8]WIE61381.1 hypothetical protein DEI97_016810 [Curtobacterium sp. MCLR17_032]